jgi:hypothetical protein
VISILDADRTRFKRTDVLAASGLAILTLVLALYFAPRGFHGGFVDLGHDGYQLRQALDLASGGVIFRDTFDQYGPLNGYLNTIGFLALGRRLIAMKYFMGLWYAASVVVLFVMARQWLDTGLATFSALVWLGLAPFYRHGIMISPHAYALLFQTTATLIALRTRHFDARRFAVIGLLAGLGWAVKQSLGGLYLAAIVSWLLIWLRRDGEPWRRVAAAIAATGATFFLVVALSIALLWFKGAVRDWYLQTAAFPRQFYLSGGAVSSLFAPFASIVQMQMSQPAYWIIIRAAVLVAAAAQLFRGRGDDLLLVASVTVFLWLATYPSGNYMHQWWTASLTFAPFVVCARRVLIPWMSIERASWMAAVLVLIVIAPGLRDRLEASVVRTVTLTEVLEEPPLFRGIRTDPATKRALDTLNNAVIAYRADHPKVKIASIDSADGWAWTAESLPLLSFVDDNTHPHPVYWNLPVLSTVVYPEYSSALWRSVRDERPLIVDHRHGEYHPIQICQYKILAAVKSDVGYWYLYAPDRSGEAASRIGDVDDDWLGCPEDGSGPGLAKPRFAVAGAWRGTVAATHAVQEPVRLAEQPALEIVDPSLAAADRPVNVYTWPSALARVRLDAPIEPMTAETTWRGGKDDIVRDLSPGKWIVDGYTKQRLGYLLQWDEQQIVAGARFVARGELFEGGLEIGLMRHQTWIASVCVSRPGPFETVIQVQRGGRYALALANCIEPRRETPPRSSLLTLFLRQREEEMSANRFRVSEAGWLAVSAGAPGGAASKSDVHPLRHDADERAVVARQ